MHITDKLLLMLTGNIYLFRFSAVNNNDITKKAVLGRALDVVIIY